MLVKIVSFWWPHVHGVFSPSIEIAFVRLLFICPNSKTNVVNVFVCLQDILSSIDPLLPAALVKCLYLLVCLPAKADNVETEQTFQEPLTKVNSPNWTYFFLLYHCTICFFFLILQSPAAARLRCVCFIQCFFFPGPAPALQTAGQCGAAGGNSGDAVSYHRPHVAVGPDKRPMEAPGLPCPQGGLCCGNQQHRPMLARWRNILICLLSASLRHELIE